MTTAPTTTRVLTVAGSDSGGGAGIQADIKTVTMLGGHAMTALTAITAQNTLGMQTVMPVPTDMVIAQMRSCIDDIGVDAVKLGMIGSAATAHAVADVLAALDVPIVFDPVMVATSGSVLADADTIAAFGRLMGIAVVVTPNPDELARLSGSDDRSDLGVWDAAAALAERYSTGILATGTRLAGGSVRSASGVTATENLIFDRLFTSSAADGYQEWEWSDPIIATIHDHGTGCTLAAAIAVGLGQGMALPQSVERARRFVRASLEAAPGLGQGHGPMGQQYVRNF